MTTTTIIVFNSDRLNGTVTVRFAYNRKNTARRERQWQIDQYRGTVCQLGPASVLARACSFDFEGNLHRIASNIYHTKEVLQNSGKQARQALAGSSLPSWEGPK